MNPFVWITARDGSIHVTRPPIIASGQPMLCTRRYGRLDLRVRASGRQAGCPAGACIACCAAATVAFPPMPALSTSG